MSASRSPACPTEGRAAWIPLKKATVLQGLGGILMVLVILNALSGTVADPDLWGYMSLGGCSGRPGDSPTRTPLPTFPP